MSQNEAIIEHLLAGNSITSLEAYLKFKCLRLAARIAEIRQAIRIETTTVELPSGKRVAQYRLAR